MCNFYNIFLYFLIQSLFSFRFFSSVLILLTLRYYEDRLEYILLKQHQQLKIMKNCLVFFATYYYPHCFYFWPFRIILTHKNPVKHAFYGVFAFYYSVRSAITGSFLAAKPEGIKPAIKVSTTLITIRPIAPHHGIAAIP